MPQTPDYIRISEEIIGDLRSGKVKPGDKLPSIADMSDRFDVSSSTIQMVYVRLEALRVIRRHQGKGIFVTDPKTWMREPSP
ncbi:winged helix-turn-helix domain-containing protein [Micromonospora sp. RB23]|uniref:winged helix-turn-helix domain-containing protein n=2 Tax=Micromonospora TaxID=1873 RepID=UPI003BF5D002